MGSLRSHVKVKDRCWSGTIGVSKYSRRTHEAQAEAPRRKGNRLPIRSDERPEPWADAERRRSTIRNYERPSQQQHPAGKRLHPPAVVVRPLCRGRPVCHWLTARTGHPGGPADPSPGRSSIDTRPPSPLWHGEWRPVRALPTRWRRWRASRLCAPRYGPARRCRGTTGADRPTRWRTEEPRSTRRAPGGGARPPRASGSR